MKYIVEGIIQALKLLLQMDRELYSIIFLSIFVSLTATMIVALIFMPMAIALGLKRIRGESLLTRFFFSMMGIPSVVVGLVVALLISRRSPLGFLGLLYTPTAMIIAQTLLIIPLGVGLTYKLSKREGRRIKNEGKLLGAGRIEIILLVIFELKEEILVIALTCFSRAITEVGAVMIVGGNIKGKTRVMTTTISMLNSMGDYPMGIALGIILVLITLLINIGVYILHKED